MKIRKVTSKPSDLAPVIRLWQENRKTLGFFPEGAFVYHASKGWILGAFTPEGALIGYILYRVTTRASIWPVAVIVHLCVDTSARSSGVARRLLHALRDNSQATLLRIELKCRRDYDATDVWPHLGFIYSGETPGRAGLPLAKWEIPLRQPPLLALLAKTEILSPLRAVLDANVFFRIQDPVPASPRPSRLLSEEAKSLTADWLSDDVALLVTDELFNEIAKNASSSERKRRMEFARTFHRLTPDVSRLDSTLKSIRDVFGHTGASHVSDRRQLAHAIAAGERLFVSQDRRLLRKSNAISATYGLEIVTPGEIVARIDELARALEYTPSGIAGSRRVATTRLSSEELPVIFSTFRSDRTRERRGHFDTEIRALIANPANAAVVVFNDPSSGVRYAMVGIDHTQNPVTRVPVLRTSPLPMAPTVLRYAVRWILLRTFKTGSYLTVISDPNLPEHASTALAEFGFARFNGEWLKCSISSAQTISQTALILRDARAQHPAYQDYFGPLIDLVEAAQSNDDPLLQADLERSLWPLKFTDSTLPSYVVPIKPMWAQHLFEQSLADQTLWGSDDEVALLNENVYYRSRRSPWPLIGPGRILWYVSRQPGYAGTMHIRACSSLDEVTVGLAKDLYHRYKRLGIYTWKDIVRTAGSASGEVMAMRFSRTELFPKPIPLHEIRSTIALEEGRHPVLQSPMRILPSSFARLYQLGTNRHGASLQ